MRHLAARGGLAEVLDIDSAGTMGWHEGKPPDHRMISAARKRGIAMTGRARQLTGRDFREFDLILTMDEENLRDVKALAARQDEPPRQRARVVAFREYCERHQVSSVPDPYYGGPEDFERVLDLLEDGCSVILRRYSDGTL